MVQMHDRQRTTSPFGSVVWCSEWDRKQTKTRWPGPAGLALASRYATQDPRCLLSIQGLGWNSVTKKYQKFDIGSIEGSSRKLTITASCSFLNRVPPPEGHGYRRSRCAGLDVC